ncbi:MAG: hypothetical protein MK365_12150 [Vicinamibacterales bacterium]|jgi:hypothetical protein|nr:hypothetical protein [Vicinamibacterales bacterium]
MARMIRKQVYVEVRHDRMLKRRARRQGVTEAEIIREALDGAARGGALARGRGGHDPDAARGALAFMRSLATRRVKGKRGRGWSRDDLYEDRIGRWAKS